MGGNSVRYPGWYPPGTSSPSYMDALGVHASQLAVPPQKKGCIVSPSASSPVDIAEHDLSSSSGSDDGAAQQPESPLARKKGQTLPVRDQPVKTSERVAREDPVRAVG